MDPSTSRSTGGRAGTVRDQCAQQTGLPFLEFLSATEVESIWRDWKHKWRNRIYTPWITLSMRGAANSGQEASAGDDHGFFLNYVPPWPGRAGHLLASSAPIHLRIARLPPLWTGQPAWINSLLMGPK